MDQIPCPGCRTLLDAEVTCCPICLRPRSKYEITRAYTHKREDDARRRKRPFIAAGWLVLASAAGYAAWRFRAPLLGAVASARAKISGFADYSMDPRNLVTKSAETPAASTETADAPAPAPFAQTLPPVPTGPAVATPPTPGRGAVMPTESPAGPPSPSGPARPERLRMPMINPATQWTLTGRAFDIVTLKPAANVQLLFQAGDTGGTVGTTTTDNFGRYAAALPRLQQGSMTALAADDRFASMVMCEPDIPYRTLSAEERRQMARSAQDGDMRPAALTDTTGEATLQRDLFLAPAR